MLAATTNDDPYLGLPPVIYPTGNIPSEAKATLGKTIFFDKRLSGDGTISCANCHQPELAFSDGRVLALGIGGRTGTRNTPSIINAAFNTSQFWDGRRESLEEQALDPLFNPREHGLIDRDALLKFLRNDAQYVLAPLPNQLSTASEGGFAYLALLILLAIISIAAAASVQMGSILQRWAAEEELLKIGSEFRRALISYSNATPPGFSSYPPTLQALLKDTRYPSIRRHLRNLYFDPLTGSQQWGTIMSQDGKGIVGIYSLSKEVPIKVANFKPQFIQFTDKTSYSDWVFTAVAPILANSLTTPSANTTNTLNVVNSNSIQGLNK